jgi:hypothetical protein
MESVATHCDNLQRVVFLGATKLGYAGIRYCDALEYVYLGEGMNDLPEHTVYSCSSLKAIVIPDSVTSLNKDSFSVSRNVWLCFLSPQNAEAVIEAVKANGSFTAFLYSETPPTEAGNWWHFDENGVPVAYK